MNISAALDCPADNQHMALLYRDDVNKNAAISRFINEGLSRGQLCVYGSVLIRDNGHQDKILSLVKDGARHRSMGNLLFVDMAPIYVAAMAGDLGPFNEARDQLVQAVKDRPDKHIRFVGDCAGLLFKNRHFEECLMVEGWGQQKPFVGSYLCPYHKEFESKHPYEMHFESILSIKHDLAIDADEMKVLEAKPGLGDNNTGDSNRMEGNN
jgi:hypothetical protein